MYRFNQRRINPVEGESQQPKTNANCYGFTLIELLAAIAIIAVLIGLLLPVIQTRREEYASSRATQNVTAIILASNEYFIRLGSYPNSISELFQFCSATPGACSLDPQLASGRSGGYSYDFNNDSDVDGADFLIVAEPEFPGITGSITHTYDSDLALITSTPTPGADEARQQAFNDILVSGARAVVDLLAMHPDATSEVRAYTGSTTVNAGTLNSLDTNHDGDVNINEVVAADNTLGSFSPAVSGFLDAVYRDLKWDDLSEQDREAVRVATGDVNGDASAALFSYDGLAELTRMLFISAQDGTSNTILMQLTARLEEAEAAEAAGNQKGKAKALKKYRKLVKSQRGQTFTRANGNMLITLSDTLFD